MIHNQFDVQDTESSASLPQIEMMSIDDAVSIIQNVSNHIFTDNMEGITDDI
jgi:hypothetical protein